MTVINNKVFLHLPKCGGTSFNNKLKDKQSEISYFSRHGSIDFLPKIFKNYPVYAFVRNPLTWYISDYYYHVELIRSNYNFNNLTKVLIYEDNNIVTLDEFIIRCTDLDAFFTAEKCKIFKDYMSKGVNVGTTNGWIKQIIPDIQLIKPHFLNGTVYQLYVMGLGIQNANIYQMEKQEHRKAIYKMFGVQDNIKLNASSEFKQNLSVAMANRILEKDKYLFELFKYSRNKDDKNE